MKSSLIALALGLAVASPAFAQVKIEKAATVTGKKADRITWTDAAGKEDTMALVADAAKEDKAGGYITYFSYFAGDEKRECKGGGDNSFGHLVMHGARKNPGWATSLHDTAKCHVEPLLEGPNHTIYRALMDIKSDKGIITATVDYFIRTGRSDFVWSVTFDSSKTDGLGADTRSPYVEFDWEGVPPGGDGGKISGMGWAAKGKQFRTTGEETSANVSWDWTKDCIIPHVIEWKTKSLGDAEIGLIQTQTYKQHDAGAGGWNQAGKSGTKLPAAWDLTYQLNAYQKFSTKRVTWMMPYGAVGAKTYTTFDNRKAVGFPYQSYAVLCMLDRYSDGGTDATIAEMVAVQSLCKLTASVGTVAVKGPAGAGRTDTVDYDPAGWDPIYATWNVACKDNAADCLLNVGEAMGAAAAAGGAAEATLPKPTFCFTNYTAATPPAAVTVKVVTASAKSTSALMSLDRAGKRLFVTLTAPVDKSVALSFAGPKN